MAGATGGTATVRDEEAKLDPRRRVVELGGEEADAGVGPYAIASDGENYLYVTDAKLEAVLVFRARPELKLIRRYHLPGGPGPIRYDHERRRLFVTLTETDETVELRGGARVALLEPRR